MREIGITRFGLAAALLLTPACREPTEDNAAALEEDLEFLDAIVRHHEVAIAMADTVFEHGESPRVQRVAHSVKFRQQDEIAWLAATRQRLTGSEHGDVGSPPEDADRGTLQTAIGPDLDRLFLAEMIAHHASAIEMAREALPKLEVVHVKAIALKILREEPEEISMMRDTLEEIVE